MSPQRSRRRAAILSLAAATVTLLSVAPATAAPPSSSAEVSPTTVGQGQTFTVTEQIYNTQQFTITNAKAALYGAPQSLVDTADLVSCTGATADCSAYFSSFRAPVGDLPAGESRTVTFTFRVKDDAQPGPLTVQTQLVGDNYALETLDGPVLTVTGTPPAADIGVSVTATPRGIPSNITYAITVTNHGPGAATAIRLAATYPAGLQYSGSNGCTRVGTTRNVTCDIASLASGATTTVNFSTVAGLLALGPFTTTVHRQQSTPADPNASNDSAARTCTALTGLIVKC
jgi:uncharacterized repeat protein (TIGR01451 family)